MEHYDYYDPGDSLDDFSSIFGFILALFLIAFIVLGTILDFFSRVPKWIYWTVLVLTAMLFEYWFIHWEFAKACAIGCTFIVAALAFLIPAAQLENENCKASSVFKLWRKTKLLFSHTRLMLIFEGLVLAAALYVHFRDGIAVYWPGVITTLIVFPLLTYSIGYFTVQSHHRYAPE